MTGDLDEFLPGEHVGKDEFFSLRCLQGRVDLTVVDDLQCGGRVDIRDGGDISHLGIVHKGQSDKGNRRHQSADEDKGRASAQLAVVPIGNRAEDRQHKQGKHVVQGHDRTGGRLGKAKFVGQDQRDGVVVGLPESADEKKGKADKNRAFVVQLHGCFSPIRS